MKLLAGILLVLGVGAFLLFGSKVANFSFESNSGKIAEVGVVERAPINIIFAGDVMLGRAVEEQYKQKDIFENVRAAFSRADAVVVNLEGPVLSNHIKTPYNSYKFSFATSTLNLLKDAGVTDVSLANNHTDNYGRDGYVETILSLKSSGINSFGDPNTISEYSVSEREISGKKFIFAGINDTYGNLAEGKIIELAKNTRDKFSDAFFVFVIHWGEEYKVIANDRQVRIGRGLVDAGVDLIIGSHPHVVQNIEKYNGKFIFYSLGNFVFDQYFSTSTQEGLAVNLKIFEGYVEAELLPISLYGSAPEFVAGDKRVNRLKEYSELSASLKDEVMSGVLK